MVALELAEGAAVIRRTEADRAHDGRHGRLDRFVRDELGHIQQRIGERERAHVGDLSGEHGNEEQEKLCECRYRTTHVAEHNDPRLARRPRFEGEPERNAVEAGIAPQRSPHVEPPVPRSSLHAALPRYQAARHLGDERSHPLEIPAIYVCEAHVAQKAIVQSLCVARSTRGQSPLDQIAREFHDGRAAFR